MEGRYIQCVRLGSIGKWHLGREFKDIARTKASIASLIRSFQSDIPSHFGKISPKG